MCICGLKLRELRGIFNQKVEYIKGRLPAAHLRIEGGVSRRIVVHFVRIEVVCSIYYQTHTHTHITVQYIYKPGKPRTFYLFNNTCDMKKSAREL